MNDKPMVGVRVYEVEPDELSQGQYVFWEEDDAFYARPPDSHLIANLSGHEIVEHEDGTISVSPSILVRGRTVDGQNSWHGYLIRGVWSKAD